MAIAIWSIVKAVPTIVAFRSERRCKSAVRYSTLPKLNEVFGISTSVPRYTYVDRLGLDAQFEYFLSADRHVIVHGGSKQGKTVLRRRHLSEAQSVVVPCGPDDTLTSIFDRILANTGARIASSSSRKESSVGGSELEDSAALDFGLFKLGTKAANSEKREATVSLEVEHVGSKDSIDIVVKAVLASRRRLVIEDFHYLTEDERKKLAFALKGMWDAKVFVIIVGIWAEQNLLVVYNNDLAGRVEEIDIKWLEKELRQVVSEGEAALNVSFAPVIVDELVIDANANVGLLQRLLEGICLEANVLETMRDATTVDDVDLLRKCRTRICLSAERRYFTFANVVSRGFKNPERTKLKLYRQIVRACIEGCSDDELINGIERDVLLAKVQEFEPDADLQNLQKALIRIDRLQAERSVNPVVLSYGEISRRLTLVDRELLFFRKYNEKPWPWTIGYIDSFEES